MEVEEQKRTEAGLICTRFMTYRGRAAAVYGNYALRVILGQDQGGKSSAYPTLGIEN